MAAPKNTEKNIDKDAPKSTAKDAPKETPKSTAKDAPKVVTPEAPKASGKDAPENARKAVAQEAPEETQRSAVNDTNPTAATNRFSGIYPNNTYPLVEGALDEVQEQRKQARDEGARTRRVSSNTARPAHPPLAEKFKTNDHATRTAEVEAADVVA